MMECAGELTMLVIDDDERYVDALFRDGRRHGIHLLHAASLEEGKALFEGPDGSAVCGIILDVECYRRCDQETPDSSFIIAATKYFNEKAPDLPLVAITGVQPLYDRYRSDFDGIWRVYRKGGDENEMLSWIAWKARGLERVKIVNRFRDVFAVVEKHLGGDARNELLDCVAHADEEGLPAIRGNLANIRSLQEKLYVALHRIDPELVPERLVEPKEGDEGKRSVNVAAILDHLKGGYDPKLQRNTGKVHLHYRSIFYRFSETVYKVSSDGIHAIDDGAPTKPTRYTVRSVLYALMDLILWFQRVVEERRGRE